MGPLTSRAVGGDDDAMPVFTSSAPRATPRLWLSIPIAIGFLVALAGPVDAQEADAEGSKDHPVFSRMPGFYINNYDEQEFSSFDFSLDPERKVEGHYWSIQYVLNEGVRKPGPLQIGRNYTNLIRQRGGALLLEALDPSGGTTIARLPVQGAGTIWLEVRVSNGGEMYTLEIVQESTMAQDVVFTAESLAAAIRSTGSVAIRDILFDTGKSTIQPASAATLTLIADALKADAALVIEIQGHTDNVGAAAANLALSRERAAAVKAALVQAGIDDGRLTTSGFGGTQPVADNSTDEGRARNRRVELIRK
ncbi:MAG: OmpA family protein [Acidimicrobiia bacterium]|nr:OmpA family protein [Acidimicrobiia bacterium]